MNDTTDRVPLFAVHEVTYRYDAITALDRVMLSIEQGKRIALLGANGSGKSTLLRLLDALDYPQQGEIRFDGTVLDEKRLRDDEFAFAFRRRVGLVFQNPDVQLFNPTVFDEVAFAPLQLRWPKATIHERVGDILNAMDLAHLSDRSPHRLSGGEKKRVAIASVLVVDPDVLLLDEPTGGLDPKSQSQIIDLLVGWSGGLKTTIAATNDLGIVEDIADRCIVLSAGRVVAEGPASAIVHDEELLRRTGLLHAHRHAHASGEVHSHPHLHHHHEH
jgi:cobalt/nickel transport system ATP-binding protein